MPYKDPEIRRIKQRGYTKKFRDNMTPEERESYLAQQREIKKTWYESLSEEDKSAYLKRHNAQLRQRYSSSFATRLRIKESNFQQYREKREEVIVHLGGRCSNPDCTSFNLDGSRGCTDTRCLQIDHVKGNGAQARKHSSEHGTVFYRKVLTTVPGEEYQLLCANCNWIKRAVNRELPQARFVDDSFVFVDHRKLRTKDELGRFVAVDKELPQSRIATAGA
jgi:hypothetical protein